MTLLKCVLGTIIAFEVIEVVVAVYLVSGHR